ncbi:hypothetical protein B0H13DRAFT_1890788 [Mycena leptocephala]|nr:hypothetical protein B0H13DRAFT_1890788 [Mycena leptocephala]
MNLARGLTGRDGTPFTGPVRAVKTATASIPSGQFLGPAVLELDTPWVPVVVHGIPARSLVDSLKFAQKDFWTALKVTGNGPAEVKAIRVLCREEDLEAREELSLRLTFSDAGAAKRFLSAGVFLFGTHCRVSRYAPRASRRPSA